MADSIFCKIAKSFALYGLKFCFFGFSSLTKFPDLRKYVYFPKCYRPEELDTKDINKQDFLFVFEFHRFVRRCETLAQILILSTFLYSVTLDLCRHLYKNFLSYYTTAFIQYTSMKSVSKAIPTKSYLAVK